MLETNRLPQQPVSGSIYNQQRNICQQQNIISTSKRQQQSRIQLTTCWPAKNKQTNFSNSFVKPSFPPFFVRQFMLESLQY